MDRKSYLCDSECGIVVGARRDDLSILETAEMFLVGFLEIRSEKNGKTAFQLIRRQRELK